MDKRQQLLLSTRKYLNISQAQMAKILNLSQSKIARIELGKSPIWDHEWKPLVDKLHINEHDGHNEDPHYSSHEVLDKIYQKIHLTPKMVSTPSLTMRSILSTLYLVRYELGKEKEVNELLEDYPVFKTYEKFHDFKVNPLYLHQFTQDILDNGLGNGIHLSTIESSFNKGALTPQIYQGFVSATTPFEKLSYALSINHKYFDFTYFSSFKKRGLLYLNFHFLVPRAYNLVNVCAYQHRYLQACANFGLDMSHTHIVKDKCYFKGDEACRFVVHS